MTLDAQVCPFCSEPLPTIPSTCASCGRFIDNTITSFTSAVSSSHLKSRFDGLWQFLLALRRFLRVEYLAFSLTLPLFGVATVPIKPSGIQLLCLLVVATAFHVFMCLENDIVDLPLDRTHPGRADYPLVRGTITLWQAVLMMVLQIPLMFAITAWQGNRLEAYITLIIGMIGMTLYNVWGKRTPFPIVTDIVQGVAFASVCLYGAVVFSKPTSLSAMMFGLVVVWMVVTNFLGGMRDLASDLQYGVLTTPIQLGVKPQGDNGLVVPLVAKIYMWGWWALMFGLMVVALIRNEFGYSPQTLLITSIAFVVALLLSGAILQSVFSSVDDGIVWVARGEFELGSSAVAMLIVLLAQMDLWVLFLLIAIIVTPYVVYNPARDIGVRLGKSRAH